MAAEPCEVTALPFSAPRLCPREGPDSSIQSPPPFTCQPFPSPHPPSFSSHLLSLCGWREGVAILGSLHPTLSRGKSFRSLVPAPARLKLGQSGARSLHGPLRPVIDPRLVCPCSQRVPSGPPAALVAPLVLCSSSEREAANSFAGSEHGRWEGAFLPTLFPRLAGRAAHCDQQEIQMGLQSPQAHTSQEGFRLRQNCL